MRNNLRWRYGKAGLSGTWDCPLPPGFAQLFREMAQVYFYSATKGESVWLQRMSESMNNLLVEYYTINKIPAKNWSLVPGEPGAKFTGKMNKDRHTVMFTGGKDSLHALLYFLDKQGGPENIQCIYIPNINKSESIYERKTVETICDKLGVNFKIVEVSNSVRINRENHNIGLRDQLLVVLALPYIVEFGSQNVTFGLHDAFSKISGPLFTSHSSAFNHLIKRIEKNGIQIAIKPHPQTPITELEITTDLIKKWPDYFWMTNSCYRQLNFREKQHQTTKERHPDFRIYNGCGNCLKCVRINGILALFDSSGNKAARWNMAKEVNNFYVTKFEGDSSLHEIVMQLRADVLETEKANVTAKA